MGEDAVQSLLSRAFRIDQRIDAKLAQIELLREQATRPSASLPGRLRGGTPDPHRQQETIARLVDLQAEVEADIDALIGTKRELMRIIKCVSSPDHQTLLELRYLCFKGWDEISQAMDFKPRHVYQMHRRALTELAKSRKEWQIPTF